MRRTTYVSSSPSGGIATRGQWAESGYRTMASESRSAGIASRTRSCMSASAALASSITLRSGSPNEVGTTKMAAEREAARARWTAPGNAGRSTFLFMRCRRCSFVICYWEVPPFVVKKNFLQRAVGALRAPTQAMATPPGHSAGRGSAEGARGRHPAGPSSGGGKPAGVAGTPLYLRWGSTALVDGDTETDPPPYPEPLPEGNPLA